MALEGRGAACCYLCLHPLPPRAGNEASGCSASCANPTQHEKLLHGDCCARSDTCPICAVAKNQPQSPALRLLSQGGQACIKARATGTSDEQHKADTRLHTLLTEVARLAYKQDEQVCGLLCVSGVVGVVCECVRSGDEALVTRAIHLLDSLAAGQSAAHTPRVYGAKACEALLRAGVAEALGQAQRQHEQCKGVGDLASSLLSVLTTACPGVADNAAPSPFGRLGASQKLPGSSLMSNSGSLPPPSPRRLLQPLPTRHTLMDTGSLRPTPASPASSPSPSPASPVAQTGKPGTPPRFAFQTPMEPSPSPAPPPSSSSSSSSPKATSGLPPLSPRSKALNALSQPGHAGSRSLLLHLDSPPLHDPLPDMKEEPSTTTTSSSSSEPPVSLPDKPMGQPSSATQVARLASPTPPLTGLAPPPSEAPPPSPHKGAPTPRSARKGSASPPSCPPPEPSEPSGPDQRPSRRQSNFIVKATGPRRSQAMLGIAASGADGDGLSLISGGGEAPMSQQSIYIRRASTRQSISAAAGAGPGGPRRSLVGAGNYQLAPGSMLEGARRGSKAHRPSVVLSSGEPQQDMSRSDEPDARRPSSVHSPTSAPPSSARGPSVDPQLGLRRSFSSPVHLVTAPSAPPPVAVAVAVGGRGSGVTRGPVLRVASAIGTAESGGYSNGGASTGGGGDRSSLRAFSVFRSQRSQSRGSRDSFSSSTGGDDLDDVAEESEAEAEDEDQW